MKISFPTFSIRRWRVIVTLSVILPLAACSSIRFGYNHADTFLVFRLNQYLDLEQSQKQLARDRISALLAWHRATQLQDYSALLGEIRAKLNGPVTPSEVINFQAMIRQRLETLGERAAPEIARLALTLKPSQIAQVQRELDEDNAEFREEYGYSHDPSDDNPQARAKLVIKRAEFWLGKLTERQRAMIRQAMAERDSGNYTWADEREARQREFLALLSKIERQKPQERVATDWVRSYFTELAHQTNPQRQAFVETSRRANAELIAKLLNSATPKQRTALDKKLQGYAADLAALLEENRRLGQYTSPLPPDEISVRPEAKAPQHPR